MSWKERFFTGGEDVEEIAPLYDIKSYHLTSFFIVLHSIMIFVLMLNKSWHALVFLLISFLTVLKTRELLP